MSNDTYQVDPQDQERFVQRDGYRVVEKKFTTDELKGITYHVIQGENLDYWRGRLDENLLTDMINQEVAIMMRNRAKARIPRYDDKAINSEKIQELVANSPCIYSIEDAEAFQPGIRELTLQGLSRQMQKAFKEAADAMGKGDVEGYKTANERAFALMGQIKDKMEEERKRVLAGSPE